MNCKDKMDMEFKERELEPIYSEVITMPEDADAEPEISEMDLADVFSVTTQGNIVFNVPDTMQLKETRSIQLLLSSTKTVQELEKAIESSGSLRHRKIKISKVMVANLKGTGFKVETITEPVQIVNLQGTTQWRWQVTALQPGARELFLTISAIVNINGQDRPHTIHSHAEIILIHVSWNQMISGFVSHNWQWLWTTILVPFAGWFLELRRKRKRG
ncbi:MAG: hypothetical protein ACT6FF_05255 [Methanosarcinaceae archaeon]